MLNQNKAQIFNAVNFTTTAVGIALAAMVFAVIAIADVSAVGTVSARSLVTAKEKALRNQRTVSSLEVIRYHSFAINISEQN